MATQTEIGETIAGAPRKGRVYVRKTDVVLQAAEQAFLKSGFDAVSMDQIAELAGVSKVTVYNNFGRKQDLFAAVITKRCAEVLPNPVRVSTLARRTPQDALTALATDFLRAIYAEEQVELYKTVVAEARHMPEIGRIMFDGPIMHTQQVFETYLAEEVRLGRLALEDVSLSAALLIAMLKTNLHLRLLLNQPIRVGRKDIRAIADSAVKLFLHGAAARPPPTEAAYDPDAAPASPSRRRRRG